MKTLLGAQGELHTHGNRSVRVTVIKWIWKYRGLVCQAEAWREPTARPLLLTLLLPPSSLLWSPYLSTSLLKLALQILSPPPPRLQKLITSHMCTSYFSSLSFSQIMVLTDPEFESSVLISSDEGASYQKYRLTFYVLSLLFHPTEEDWALAYSHDQKVRLCSMSHFFSCPFLTFWVTYRTYSLGPVAFISVVNNLMVAHSSTCWIWTLLNNVNSKIVV